MQPNPIDDAGPLKALIVNLYTGWGYNAYRQENRNRADDLLIRNGVCGLLGEARASLDAHASDIRRSIPTPSRETPFPGAEQRRQIAEIEAASREVEAVETQIRHLPVPENDSTWLRHRNERDFLPRLAAADVAMVSAALQLRKAVRAGYDKVLIDLALATLRQQIEGRKQLLSFIG